MSIESDQDLVHQARFAKQGDDVDWIAMAGATVRITMAYEAAVNGQPTEDPAERIAFSEDITRKILDHPHELTVFYHSENRDDEIAPLHFLTAMIPAKDQPFDFYYAGKSREKIEISRLSSRMNVNPEAGGSNSIHPLIANRQINFRGIDEDPTVWMGAGSDAEDRSADFFYLQRQNRTQEILVGTAEISKFMGKLAEDGETNRAKVLGAAVHVGYLAVAFNAPIPSVPELSKETSEQLKLVYKNSEVSDQVAATDSELVQQLVAVSQAFRKSREWLEALHNNINSLAIRSAQPYMGDSRTWPRMDIYEHRQVAGNLLAVEVALAREKDEHRRRVCEYALYAEVLRALKG